MFHSWTCCCFLAERWSLLCARNWNKRRSEEQSSGDQPVTNPEQTIWTRAASRDSSGWQGVVDWLGVFFAKALRSSGQGRSIGNTWTSSNATGHERSSQAGAMDSQASNIEAGQSRRRLQRPWRSATSAAQRSEALSHAADVSKRRWVKRTASAHGWLTHCCLLCCRCCRCPVDLFPPLLSSFVGHASVFCPCFPSHGSRS